ncbi:MAG: MscL family protein [Mycoplasmatales bacterium]|nr:MscL family protein [Mycoplasmatales bacterium]
MFKKSWKDTKKVVSRGNMFMLAIGMLLGTAFGLVVKSLANDVIMGAIAKAFGYKGVAYMSVGTTKWDTVRILDSSTAGFHFEHGLPLNGVMYGKFLSALIGFVVVSFFIIIALMAVYLIINYRHRNDPVPAPAAPTVDEQILEELKKLNSSKTTSKVKEEKSVEEKAPAKKVTTKAPVKKATTKKTTTKKAPAKKTVVKKTTKK